MSLQSPLNIYSSGFDSIADTITNTTLINHNESKLLNRLSSMSSQLSDYTSIPTSHGFLNEVKDLINDAYQQLRKYELPIENVNANNNNNNSQSKSYNVLYDSVDTSNNTNQNHILNQYQTPPPSNGSNHILYSTPINQIKGFHYANANSINNNNINNDSLIYDIDDLGINSPIDIDFFDEELF